MIYKIYGALELAVLEALTTRVRSAVPTQIRAIHLLCTKLVSYMRSLHSSWIGPSLA